MASGRRLVRQAVELVLNLLIAMFVTSFFEVPLYRSLSYVFHLKTVNGVLIQESLATLMIAVLIGFLVHTIWRSQAAKWVWVIGISIFAARAASLVGSPHGVWFQMSGGACIDGTRALGCMNYFIFTLVALRSVGYSVGAWVSWRFRAFGAAFVLDSVFARFRNPFLPPSPDNLRPE